MSEPYYMHSEGVPYRKSVQSVKNLHIFQKWRINKWGCSYFTP